MTMKNKKACLQMRQGSILAYSLIIIATMLAIAGSLSVSSIIEKKSASGTEFSMQSLQTADSGVQLALKKINTELAKSDPGTITTAMVSGCTDSTFSSIDGAAGPSGSSYALTFLKADGTTLACSDEVSLVAEIKSVGTYKNTVRAVSVAVEALADPNWLAGPASAGGYNPGNFSSVSPAECQMLLDAIRVYKSDEATKLQWKTTMTACDTPQCGQDGAATDDLVASNSPDFSAYPARDACKAIDGRLPTLNELKCINANNTNYGTFQSGAFYWSSEEYSASSASRVLFNAYSNNAPTYTKTSYNYVRCVR